MFHILLFAFRFLITLGFVMLFTGVESFLIAGGVISSSISGSLVFYCVPFVVSYFFVSFLENKFFMNSFKNGSEVPDYLRDDYDFVKRAVTDDAPSFQYASERLRDNKEIALISAKGSWKSTFEKENVYEFVSDRLKMDVDVVRAAFESDNSDDLHKNILIDDFDKETKEQVLLIMMKYHPETYEDYYIGESGDTAFILDAVEQNVEVLKYVESKYKVDKAFIMDATKRKINVFHNLDYLTKAHLSKQSLRDFDYYFDTKRSIYLKYNNEGIKLIVASASDLVGVLKLPLNRVLSFLSFTSLRKYLLAFSIKPTIMLPSQPETSQNLEVEKRQSIDTEASNSKHNQNLDDLLNISDNGFAQNAIGS